jgi:hypothetical protein
LDGRVAMSAEDFVIIDFVVGEESVSGFAFSFLAIASGGDTQARFAGEAIEDKPGAFIEAEVIEVESGEFVVNPRVHSTASKLRTGESGEIGIAVSRTPAASQHSIVANQSRG